jgi:hypothetical protein
VIADKRQPTLHVALDALRLSLVQEAAYQLLTPVDRRPATAAVCARGTEQRPADGAFEFWYAVVRSSDGAAGICTANASKPCMNTI